MINVDLNFRKIFSPFSTFHIGRSSTLSNQTLFFAASGNIGMDIINKAPRIDERFNIRRCMFFFIIIHIKLYPPQSISWSCLTWIQGGEISCW